MDRATALVKLGETEYFNVCSIPDLFHFNQGIAHSVGASIGKAWKRAYKAYQTATGYYSERKPFEDKWLLMDVCRRRYQNGIHQIHKAVHAFNESGHFKTAKSIRKAIVQGMTQIELQGNVVGLEYSDKVLTKTFDQIPAIIKGVQDWQKWLVKRAEPLTYSINGIEPNKLREWLMSYLCPFAYWSIIYQRTPAKHRNKRLRFYYRELIQKTKIAAWETSLDQEAESRSATTILDLVKTDGLNFPKIFLTSGRPKWISSFCS